MKKVPKTEEENIIYAFHYKGKLLGTFKWSDFGPSGLQGWRPPKKLYFKLGLAKAGARWLPKEMLDDLEIIAYKPAETVMRCVRTEQEKKDLKNLIKKKERHLQYQENFAAEAKELRNFGDYDRRCKDVNEILSELNELKEKLKKYE